MLHDIEKLKKSHEESLREAVEANRIALALPVTPRSVGFALSTLPWVTYEVGTLQEALAVFKEYTPAPYAFMRSSSFASINTHAEMLRKNATGRDSWKVDIEYPEGAPYFECITGVGFSSVEMEFFTTAAERDLKIVVKIAASPIRVNLHIADPRLSVARARYRKEYPNVPGAVCVHWGYGDDCVKGTYMFPDLSTFWASMEGYGCRNV